MKNVVEMAMLLTLLAIGLAAFMFGNIIGQKTAFDNCMDYYYDMTLKEARPLCDNVVYKGTTK